MNNRLVYLGICFLCLLISLAVVTPFRITRADDKPKAADIVAKHLESIGPAEARSTLHAAQVKGTCSIVVTQGGSGQVDGQVVMVSQGSQNMIRMTFDSA